MGVWVVIDLAGLETQTQNAAFLECKRPKRKPWYRGSLYIAKNDRNAFLNASVLPRKALNCNLSWGFPLGNLLPKTRILTHRVLERKRRPNANASVFGSEKKHIKKKTRKQNFHGIVPGFWGGFCLCVFFSPIRNDPKKHINKILAPTQSRDNPANLFMFTCFSFPENF